MLIGIDASRAVVDRPTGTEIYSQCLIRALLALESSHCFRLYTRGAPSPGAFAGAEMRVMPFPRLWTHVRLSAEMITRPPDALFVPAHVLPLIRPRASLVTVHDLGYRHFPQAHPRHRRWVLDLSTRWSAGVAAHVLADSQATKDDLVAHYGMPAEKVTVAYPGYDDHLAPVSDPATIRGVKARFDIPGDYVLYLGTLQPRKNLARVIAALVGVPQVTLVLAGKRGWLYEDLFAQVNRLGLAKRVRFLGYVPEEDKAALLSGALAFVFPSLYEGFGLPVLEAQACHCPVITSTTSSLPEVAGEGALLVDPTDTQEITVALSRVVAEPRLRQALIERGRANLDRFSWAHCAQVALSTIERFVV